jgi:hypothetical protein
MADADADRQYILARVLMAQNPSAQTQSGPVMKPWEPRQVSDNIPLMLADLLRSGGASDHTANRVGDRLGGLAKYTPPVAFVDAAGDIGGAAHDGRYRDAATNASLAATFGYWAKPMGRAMGSMLPTAANRDAGMAAMMARMPQDAPPVSPSMLTWREGINNASEVPHAMRRGNFAPANDAMMGVVR